MTIESRLFVPAAHPRPYQEQHFPKFHMYPDIPQNLARPTYKGPSLDGMRRRLSGLGGIDIEDPTTRTIVGAAVLASVAASTYHGYRRNNSVGWAIWWGLMGGIFPVVTPAIALAQGFGKRKSR